MKKLIFATLLALQIPLAFASHPEIKKPQLIDVAIQITHDSDDATWKINNNLSLQNNHHWLNIGGLQTSSTSSSHQQTLPTQSLALVKIVNADSKKVTLEFLIIHKELDHYSVTQPRLVINYHQQGVIDIRDTNNTAHTNVSAIATIKA